MTKTKKSIFNLQIVSPFLATPGAGLNCGRWDYMFSFIKTLRNDPSRIFPDRGLVGMDQPFLRAYTQVGCCAMSSSMWGISGLVQRSYL